MARRRQELGLGNIGGVGLAFGARQRGVEQGEFLGALAHAPLQRLVGPLQRLGRLDARGDVGEGGHDAAVRHAVGAHLDHHALGEALEERLAAGDVYARCARRPFADALGGDIAALVVEAQDLVEPDADAGEARRQIENLAELAVPADQLQSLSNTAMPWRT